MAKLEAIDGKKTNWGGLWWHPESNCFTSQSISLSELRKFKGNVRLIVKKNKYFNDGENNRPNYVFMLADAKSETPFVLEVEETEDVEEDSGYYFDGDGNRLYTYEEVQYAINCAAEDGQRGYGYGDNLVSDYL